MTFAFRVVALFAVVMMTVMLGVFTVEFFDKFVHQRSVAFEIFKQGFAVEKFERSGDKSSFIVVLFQKFYRSRRLFFGKFIALGHDDYVGFADLVDIEFAEVFEIHFALSAVYYRAENVYLQIESGVRDGGYYVGKFTYARRFDNNAVGFVDVYHFFKGFFKVPYERTTYTARVNFFDFYAGFFKKRPVYTYFAEFVFYKSYSFFSHSRGEKFFYKGGFTRAQKSGNYVNFYHIYLLFSLLFIRCFHACNDTTF